MNWGRGLFRLWLIGSALWVITALLMTGTFEAAGTYLRGEFHRSDVTTSELSVSPISEGIITVSFEGRRYEVDTGGVQPSDPDEWARVLDAVALEMNRDAALESARLRRTRAEALTGFAVAILPPLFLLVLGASLLWAVRGFSAGQKE